MNSEQVRDRVLGIFKRLHAGEINDGIACSLVLEVLKSLVESSDEAEKVIRGLFCDNPDPEDIAMAEEWLTKHGGGR